MELQGLVFSIFHSLPLNTSGSYLPVKLSSHVRYSFSLSTVHKDLSYIKTWPPASTDVILSSSSRKYWERRRAFCSWCFVSFLLCTLPCFSLPCHIRLLCFDDFVWLSNTSHAQDMKIPWQLDCNNRPIANEYMYYFSKQLLSV